MQILELSNIDVFSVKKSSFSIKNIAKDSFSSIWPRKVKVKKLQSQPIWRVKVFSIKNVAKYCFDQFGIEKQDEETSNLWPKLLAKNDNYATF